MKIIERSEIREMVRQDSVAADSHIVNEIDIMLKLHNPHLIHIHKIIVHPEDDFVYIILKYYPNDTLKNYIEKTKNRVPESQNFNETWRTLVPVSQIRRWARELISGLYSCHMDSNVIHRDIKAENIMLDKDNSLVLVDFGISMTFENENDII